MLKLSIVWMVSNHSFRAFGRDHGPLTTWIRPWLSVLLSCCHQCSEHLPCLLPYCPAAISAVNICPASCPTALLPVLLPCCEQCSEYHCTVVASAAAGSDLPGLAHCLTGQIGSSCRQVWRLHALMCLKLCQLCPSEFGFHSKKYHKRSFGKHWSPVIASVTVNTFHSSFHSIHNECSVFFW